MPFGTSWTVNLTDHPPKTWLALFKMDMSTAYKNDFQKK